MAKGARWVRLSVDWSSSDWLAELPFDVRSCWPLLLCYVKTNGVGGECSVRKPATLARLWDAPERAVSALIDAAIEEGAVIVTDETLHVVKWADYQDDVASRVRRHRDHKRENQSDSVENEPDVTLPKRVVTNVTDVTADRDIDRDKDKDKKRENTRVPRLDPLGIVDLLPETHRTPEVVECLRLYEKHRIENKWRPWKESTRHERAKQWGALPPEVLVQAVRKSIENGWQGIFPERIPKPPPSPADRKRQLLGEVA